ncbi:cytochrome c551 [Caldalkalibacillus thermarum TA2.A1]|uniref:Cytochrome c n=1 Tax=Caldalkalibacillus thermarum (strain TA2.A1) TaxID=986075 RepID=F5L5G0_CALTT|nr:cytochrome c [Caldalkalibacillus thermarum]EGL83425.1 cytochrome c551 [Caldalkalibacillus thermarum TA2.A1]QZT33360.1 cytochrome c [Caldalkalibacillus thermarum TA2.A1]
MNPIKVFFTIFALGLGLAIVLGIIGLQQGDLAEEENGAQEDVVALDLPPSFDGCLACHGQNLEGASAPSLIDTDLSKEEIIQVLQNGLGAMPAQTHLSAEEMEEIADYLVSLDFEEGEGQQE